MPNSNDEFVASIVGDHVSPWIASAFYGSLATLQLGAGVAYAAEAAPSPVVKDALQIDIIAVTAIASSAVTLLLGLAHAWSAFVTRSRRDAALHKMQAAKANAELQWKAVEARLALLERNIPCELEGCPVLATARGEIPYDAIPLNKVPTGEINIMTAPVKGASNDEPTVDLKC